MTKKIKSIFFVLTLITLLAIVGAVCAADDANSTIAVDSSVSDVAVSDAAGDTVAAELPTTSDDNKVDTKNIEKEDKNLKNDSITIDGITYTNIIENQEINEYTELEENSYINNITINIEGEYGLDSLATTYINNSNINAYLYSTKSLFINNSNITRGLSVEGNENVYIYNSRLNSTYYGEVYCRINSMGNVNLYLYNCTLLDQITMYGKSCLFIDDNCKFCDNFTVLQEGTGNFSTNNTQLIQMIEEENLKKGIYNIDKTFENTTIDTNITNNANMTIINSQITSQITNKGNISFINCSFSNNNMTTAINNYAGNNGFLLYNTGNASLIDCIMENNTFNHSTYNSPSDGLNGAIYNTGIISFINSTFRNNIVGYQEITGEWNRGLYFGRGSIVSNIGGSLSIDNCNFTDNYAGQFGGAIENQGTLTVNNSIFTNNTAGREGGAIHILSGNVMIDNSKFTKNNMIDIIYTSGEYIGGGAISVNNNFTDITNCHFDQNYVEAPTGLIGVAAYGGAIGCSSGTVTVDNCTFTNHTSEYGSVLAGLVNIYNSVIENNRGEYVIGGGNEFINNTFTGNNNATYLITNLVNNAQIVNNDFVNNSLNGALIASNDEISITSTGNTYFNNTLNDTLTLNVPNKIYTGEDITIKGTYTLNNPEFYDEDILEQNSFNVYVNGVFQDTIDTLEFTITPKSGNMIVTVQPTISQTRKSVSIRPTTLTNVTITPENYNEYIYEESLIGVTKDTRVSFQGNFNDKGEIYIDTSDLIIDGKDANFTNTCFIIDAGNIVLANMTINNTNTTYPIKNYQDNNTIQNNKITITNANGKTAAIYVKANNTLITENTLNVTGPAGNIDWESDSSGICTTQAMLVIESENNTITYNTITVNGTDTGESFGTIEAITNSRKVKNSYIAYNNITVTGGYFNYAINQLDRINNSTVEENNILSLGFRYADGIQIGDNATNIIIRKNNITCICLNETPVDEAALTYGIITTCQGGEPSNNFTITENNLNMTGVVNYGMEIYKTTNTIITNNTITANGQQSMGIGYCHSHNSTFENNKITTNDQNITTINSVTEEIQPQSTGIKIQDSIDLIINNNTITTQDTNKKDTTIDSESTVTITNNKLTSSQDYGEETIKAPTDSTIENNIIETTITTDDITTLTNTPTTLTATVTTINGDNINGGTVTFTDSTGNTIAEAAVTDGTATATATFTQADESTITATYTPTSTGLNSSTTEATLTVKDKFQTTITIDEVTATAGETITIKANVLDENGEAVTGGKVTFKVNGKTVKDANGKVVYAKVVDGVATAQYTVPENLGGQDITVTAVYSGTNKYSKETTTITTTVTAPEAKLTITPITSDVQTGSTVTLKAKVAIGDKAITTGKIVFKVNGKTVKDENGKVIYAKVDANGEVSVDYTIPESFKAGTYNIEAVFIASGYEKLTDNTTMTVVKS